MSAGFIPAVAPILEPSLGVADLAPGDERPQGVAFAKLVGDGLQQVAEKLQTAQLDLQQLASGDVQNLHHVMVRLEETRLSFQLMLQVRNRLLESYQDVMRMQV